MRLKNLAWTLLLLPSTANTAYRAPRPIAPVIVEAGPPVPIPLPVCIGEAHDQPEHTRIEKETVLALRGRGYTTLDLEFPRDLQPALETYLHSKRDPEDARKFFATYVDLDMGPLFLPPFLRAKVIQDTENDPMLHRALDLASAGFDAGLAVHLIDVPFASPFRQPPHSAEELFANLPARNEAMSQLLAQDAARGGTAAINGDLHESRTVASESLPEALLKNSGIPCQVFELAINGKRPELAIGIAPGRLQPAGRLVSSSQEILAALDAASRPVPPRLPEVLPVAPIHDMVSAR